MALGVSAPSFYRDDGERHANHYLGRYHDLHIDLMDVLSAHGASSRASLEMVAVSMGIPAKRFLDKSIVEHALEGDAVTLESYCRLDTITTMLVFLAWAFHQGRLSRPDLDRYVAAIRLEVGRYADPRWHEIGVLLERWPPW
jgi:predicted PolB exonuclease-like 3'-5' exonuclease